jgi:hypothetical protein
MFVAMFVACLFFVVGVFHLLFLPASLAPT